MSNYKCSHCSNQAVVSATAMTDDGSIYTGHYCQECYGELPESHIHHWRNVRHTGEQPPEHSTCSPWTGLDLLVGAFVAVSIFGLLVITVLFS